jgi:hypothetical protein
MPLSEKTINTPDKKCVVDYAGDKRFISTN